MRLSKCCWKREIDNIFGDPELQKDEEIWPINRCVYIDVDLYTHPRFNISPENVPSQKKSNLSTIIFQGQGCVYWVCVIVECEASAWDTRKYLYSLKEKIHIVNRYMQISKLDFKKYIYLRIQMFVRTSWKAHIYIYIRKWLYICIYYVFSELWRWHLLGFGTSPNINCRVWRSGSWRVTWSFIGVTETNLESPSKWSPCLFIVDYHKCV